MIQLSCINPSPYLPAMADVTGAHHHAGEHSSSSSDGTPPNHLGTTVPAHNLDGNHDPEKAELHDHAAANPSHGKTLDDDEEDEDIDALIDDLESQDGGVAEEEEEEEAAGGTPPISEDFLQTSTRTGLTEAEVVQRRKKFGPNQMKEEKENLILKFLGYFVGPIQFVMEVRPSFVFIALLPLSRAIVFQCASFGSHHHPPLSSPPFAKQSSICTLTQCFDTTGCCRACCWSPGLGRLRCHLRSAATQRCRRFHPRIPSWLDRRRTQENPRAQGRRSSRWQAHGS